MRISAVLLLVASAACATKTETRDSAAAQAGDPDVAVSGSGIPSGYTAVTDDGSAQPTNLRYVTTGGGWEVTTGPAHIVYAAKDTASGSYAASVGFEQVEAPRHPEAYGIFVGGRDLSGDNRSYTYFLVRGTGEYTIKTRNGSKVSNIVDWKSDPAVAKQDSNGRATYRLKIHTTADTAHFLVDDKLVHAASLRTVPTNGIAGLRINHNLHVRTSPISIER
ncbi:MAG TPA: hypothetical protein VHM67_05005 [Gemmatimonadaceae bacterium]|nr:hypothetical protein [Gemmatimonadaceae bacterium]